MLPIYHIYQYNPIFTVVLNLKIFGSNCNLCVKQLSFSKYTTTMNLKPNFDLPLVRGVTHDLPVWMPMMLSQFMIGNI